MDTCDYMWYSGCKWFYYYYKILKMFSRIAGASKFANFSTKKFMFIFGPPGVGKGSYAARLKEDLNLNHISTGIFF